MLHNILMTNLFGYVCKKILSQMCILYEFVKLNKIKTLF